VTREDCVHRAAQALADEVVVVAEEVRARAVDGGREVHLGGGLDARHGSNPRAEGLRIERLAERCRRWAASEAQGLTL
jgi:hypothetical protein